MCTYGATTKITSLRILVDWVVSPKSVYKLSDNLRRENQTGEQRLLACNEYRLMNNTNLECL